MDDDKSDQLVNALWTGSTERRPAIPVGCWFTLSSMLTLFVLFVVLVVGVLHG